MIDGARLLTVIVTVVVALPETLVAVIVYVFDVDAAVGVPDITPVLVLKDSPEGSGELMDQLDAEPPVLAGVNELIVVPTV